MPFGVTEVFIHLFVTIVSRVKDMCYYLQYQIRTQNNLESQSKNKRLIKLLLKTKKLF